MKKSKRDSIKTNFGQREVLYESSSDQKLFKSNQYNPERYPQTQISDSKVLIQVKTAAVNLVDLLIVTGEE